MRHFVCLFFVLVACLHSKAEACDWNAKVIFNLSGESKSYKLGEEEIPVKISNRARCVIGRVSEDIIEEDGFTLQRETVSVGCFYADTPGSLFSMTIESIIGAKERGTLHLFNPSSTKRDYSIELGCG